MFNMNHHDHDEPTKTIHLLFRAMSKPMQVTVPLYILRYLETYASRNIEHDGTIVYECSETMPKMRVIPMRRKDSIPA